MKFKPVYIVYVCLIGMGFLAVMITGDIRSRSERQLISEDKATAAANRQKIAAQKVLDDFENERRQAAKDREFNQFVYGRSTPPPEVVQQQIEQHLRKLVEEKEK